MLKSCAACGGAHPAGVTCPERRGRVHASPSTRAQRDGTGDYDRHRRIVLDGDPVCAVRLRCDGAPATTADHIVPVALGGGHDLANLRPSCRPCNAARQARV